MRQQVFVFSAARGREWELAMARRMPASVRLMCVEYDDRAAVKAILGAQGADVWFPRVSTTIVQDAQGGSHALEVSDETDVLAELARDWLDGQGPTVSFRQGRMGLGADDSLHSATPSDTQGLSTGSGTTIDPAARGKHRSSRMLPDGASAGGLPPTSPSPTAPRRSSLFSSGCPIPDSRWARASRSNSATPCCCSITMPRARSTSITDATPIPTTVFAHWDALRARCVGASVLSAEAARRARFDAWASAAQLSALWNALNPGAAAAIAALSIALPPAPPDPGVAPAAPPSAPWPGLGPGPPTLTQADRVPLGG